MSKILLAEDDPLISEIYQKKFKTEGIEADVAVTGKEVLKKISENNYDVVLLDLVLPEMNGFDILKKIETTGKYSKKTKILIFSNLSEQSDFQKAMDLGADGFISKTQFSPTELVEQVKRKINEFKEQDKNSKKSITEKTEKVENRKRILLIEDEEVFVELFGKKLRDDGYEVESAKNGAWGFKEAEAKDFDLIITDLVMPAMTGSEIVAKLKLSEKTKNIPIIVLSASVPEEEAKEIEDMGIEAFFLKTKINPSDLSRKVDEILK
jgi:DNA-binding response OmpR family regulator